jgi:hypothetical protein
MADIISSLYMRSISFDVNLKSGKVNLQKSEVVRENTVAIRVSHELRSSPLLGSRWIGQSDKADVI